ncbi:ABC transporter ATP-binding protein [Staphylococcus sp. 18_1_E_LY]|uniref:ABC transporter ATP-binding protein n=1 Tax=Staphylococcus lloydii TaxID=2781774 RepID=A0A7T1AYE7_9STAP|nr:ABC transporter ATP-binding protein [Staphylococcus lloydii]MBF7019021.1 ABC transporter ATP-binding protein [Staphylococcus lloydii]MBF7026749.1 ABC transporter ATP-binding protein [Staphylococcus lloydii]QPM74407.1 ABC transporter ATP-binding protein [Staphylococcus lloydii]
MLVAKNLRLKYPNANKKIFDGLDITIKEQEKVLLLGPSGSGKSTLLNVLSGIVPELIELPLKYDQLDRDVNSGVIFQDPDTQFCMPKVYEELAFILENRQVPREQMDEEISKALQSVGLSVNKDQYVNQLSGGMKQKLAIAETLLQNANTLFLDEPTAMLDVEATEALWSKIKSLWTNQTVLIVEHKVAHIWEHIDRVILFDYDGNIIADEQPQSILTNYEHLLTEYGVWHPKAWDYAPQPIKQHTVEKTDYQLRLEQCTIKRDKRALIKINELTINQGEWITITGANGSGKTSLLESLMQLIQYEGTMYFNNKIIRKIKDIAHHAFLVYQNPELQFITNSVYDEIYVQYSNYSDTEAQQKTEAMLHELNLTEVKHQHPFELSVGQKRRLSVATALSSEAEIILLDEPTFGLDSHNTFNLIKLFQERINKGQTIVMVTHDSEIIKRYSTRRIHVENKQLVEMLGEAHV